MSYTTELIQKRRQILTGGGQQQQPNGNTATGQDSYTSNLIQQRRSSYTPPKQPQRRQVDVVQPKQEKNVFQKTGDLIKRATGNEFISPLPESQRMSKPTVIDKVKNINFRELGKSFLSGVKAIPGQTQQAGGVILSSLAKQQQAINKFYGNKGVSSAVDLLAPQISLSLKAQKKLDKKFKVSEKIDVAGKAIRETGFQKQRLVTKKREAERKGTKDGLQNLLEAVAFNAPQMFSSIGLTAATAAITKNPAAASAVGLSTSYGLGASEVYNSARDYGLTDEEALPLAQYGGIVIGAIEALPLGRIINKVGADEVVKKSLIKNIAGELVSLGTQAGLEGITEGMQEIVGNAISRTYNENQDLLEGVKESVLVGTILGGLGDVTVSGVMGITGNKSVEEMTQEVETKVEEIINKPAEKRTDVEQGIIEQLFTKEITPDQAASYVFENNLGDTDEGMKIMKAVIEAKKRQMNIGIMPSESDNSMDISVVEPGSIEKRIEEYLGERTIKFRTNESGNRVLTAPADLLVSHEGAPDLARVAEYKKKLRLGQEIEPVKIIREGTKYGIEDGKHRYEAYKQLGITDIPIEIVEAGKPKVQTQEADVVPSMNKAEFIVKNDLLYQDKTIEEYLGNRAEKFRISEEVDGKEKFRVKDDVKKITGQTITDKQEAEIIALNKKIFGDENVKITLQIMANKDALGSSKDGMIQILDGQAKPKDTFYHEAVHKFIDVFTTKKEQVDLFKAGIEKYGIEDLAQIEENIAEDFIAYASSREGLTGKIKQFIDNILQRINKYLDNADAIDTLYADILSGSKKDSDQTFDYQSTQLNLDKTLSKKITDFANTIPDADLYTEEGDRSYGREDNPHITVVYGLDTDQKTIQNIVKGEKPVEVELDKVSLFENEDYDVVKVDVKSPQLESLYGKIDKELDVPGRTFDDYKPHATIAYVKKGLGKKYAGSDNFVGDSVTLDTLSFMDKNGESFDIKLGEVKKQQPKKNIRTKKTTEVESETVPTSLTQPIDEAPGKSRKSRVLERAEEELTEIFNGMDQEYKDEIRYKQMNIAEDAARGMEFQKQNPKEAIAIAKNQLAPPPDITATSISIAAKEAARQAGDWQLFADLIRHRSFRQTRLGQEIVAERGDVNSTRPDNFINKVIKARMDIVARKKRWVVKAGKKIQNNITENINNEVNQLKKQIDAKVLKKLDSAQALINSLTCK